MCDETGKSLQYRHSMNMEKYMEVWGTSFANELGRLAQGSRDVKGTNTIKFIRRGQVLDGRTITYDRLVCDLRPQKEEKNRTQLTVGGDRLDYPHDAVCQIADITTCKLLFNSTI